MQLHNLKSNKNNRKSRQVGRGGKRGKTSGKGTKGQNARAGRKKRPEMRDIIKRLPKLRGRGKNFLKSIASKPVIISFDRLYKNFKEGEVVSPTTLLAKGLVSKTEGVMPKIKILGSSTPEKSEKVKKNFVFEGLSKSFAISSSLKSKI